MNAEEEAAELPWSRRMQIVFFDFTSHTCGWFNYKILCPDPTK